MVAIRHPLGWIPDRPDHRDFPFPHPAESEKDSHLRRWCSEVVDDGAIGMCVASAVTGAVELLLRRGGHDHHLSRSFLYLQTRMSMGIPLTLDTGSTLRDALKVMHGTGTCQESTWSSGPEHLSEPPSSVAITEAARFKISGYERLASGAEIQGALESGRPVVGGFSLPGSALTDEVSRSGTLVFPQAGQDFFGGHAVVFVGWEAGFLVFKNSWGAAWGEAGYGRLDGRFVSQGLARDFWTVTL